MGPNLLNDNVIKAVREKLPENVDIVRFLTSVLPLGKEAIYRRVRGDVVFTFSEIYLIAQNLRVSLDYFINPASENNIVFELRQQQYYELKEKDYDIFKKFEQIVKYASEDPDSRFELSHNLFPQLPTHMFYHLSKYSSFKWVYLNQKSYQTKPFKEIDYPEEVFQMHKGNNIETMKINRTCYIWDQTIFEAIVGEIKYFQGIDLLDENDVAILKGELHEFLYYVENLAEKGEYFTGNKLDIYISCVNSDAAYGYIETPRYQICMIGAFDLHYLLSTDKRAIAKMKEKMSSLKRVATLISGTGESFRVPFFSRQHRLIDTLS